MKRRTNAEWIDLGNEYYASGQNLKDWCENQGIRVNTFQERLRKLRKAGLIAKQNNPTSSSNKSLSQTDVITFVELKESQRGKHSTNPSQNEHIQIKIGKVKISIPANIEADSLKEVLKAVCEVC